MRGLRGFRRKVLLMMILVTIVTSSIFCNKQAFAENSVSNNTGIISMNTVQQVSLLEDGNARLTMQTAIDNGPLADAYRRALSAPNNTGVDESIPIPENKTDQIQAGGNSTAMVVPVRSQFYKGLEQDQLFSFGFQTAIIDSSMVPQSATNAFEFSGTAAASPYITNVTSQGSNRIWEILIGSRDKNAARQAVGYLLTKTAFTQSMLGSFEGEQSYESSWSTEIRLPEGATLLNGNELQGLKWLVDFGGGTSMSASLQIANSSEIILYERTIVTDQNFTASTNDLYNALCGYKSFKIRYSLPSTNETMTSPPIECMSNETKDDWDYSWTYTVYSGAMTFPISLGPIDASLTVTSDLTLNGYIGFDFGWTEYHGWLNIPYWIWEPQWFEAWIRPEASVQISLETSISVSYSHTWTHTIFALSHRFEFWYGILVWVDLEVSSTATLSFNAYGKVSIQVGAEATASLTAGVRWDRTKGWQSILDRSWSASHSDPTLTVEAGASITSSLDFQVAFLIYDVAGPFVDFVLSASATVEYSASVVGWDLSLDFEIDAGVTFGGWLQTLLGLGAYSIPIYQITLAEWGGHFGYAPSSISVDVNPGRIALGSAAIVSGVVSSLYGGNESGIVDIQFSADNTTWEDIGSSSSDSSGYYSYVWVPNSTGTYYVRSSWGGNPYYFGATSSPFYPFVVVSGKQASGITLSLSSGSITKGQSIVLGSQLWSFTWFWQWRLWLVLPSSDGTTSFQQSTDGISWQNINSGTPSLGSFSYNWTPPSTGVYYLRATWSGDSGYEGSVSPTSTLQVTPANTLLATSLSENTIQVGSSVNISAAMVPALQGKSLIIEYSQDNSTWYYLNLGNTDWNGQYTYSWSPDIGAYYLRSRWTGDANYFGTISDSQLLTVNEASQYHLDVYSAFSTVSGMGWYDNGTNAYATLTDKAVDVIPGSVRAVFTGWSGNASGTGLTSDPITMDGPKTAVAMWNIQFYLSVVTDPSSLPAIPGADWYENYTRVRLNATRYVPAEEGSMGVRYSFDHWDVDGVSQISGNNTLDLDMDFNHTATAHYMLQYNVMFFETSVGSDFNGTIATVDGTEYGLSDFPLSFWFSNGTTHDFAFASPLRVGLGSEQYVWSFTSGLSIQQSDALIVMGPGSVTGNYGTYVHDVAVTSVVAFVPHCSSKVGNDLWLFQGLPVYVNVTVQNKGAFDENVTVTLYYNSTSNNSAKGIDSPNILLSTGQTQTILLVWNTKAVPYCLNYTIAAVATIPLDNNPADNTLACGPINVRIMGDINGDSKVNLQDVFQVALAFGARPADSKWNSDADINGDGKINLRDFYAVISNFGKTGV